MKCLRIETETSERLIESWKLMIEKIELRFVGLKKLIDHGDENEVRDEFGSKSNQNPAGL